MQGCRQGAGRHALKPVLGRQRAAAVFQQPSHPQVHCAILPCSERLAAAERELAAAQAELASVEARSAELSGQEERYWHSLNEFQLRLQEHMDERDALAHR